MEEEEQKRTHRLNAEDDRTLSLTFLPCCFYLNDTLKNSVTFLEPSFKTNVFIRIVEKLVAICLNIVWNTYAKGAEV